MGLVEHTGHGIPTIVKKYGKEAFEIRDTHIKCVIPFDDSVVQHSNKKVGTNAGIRFKSTEKKKGIIHRIGTKKAGKWMIVQNIL